MDTATYASLELDRIILRGGAGALRFGMTPDDVRSLMGDPDYERGPDTASDDTLWSYDAVDLNLNFQNVRDRGNCLVVIWTENPAAALLGVPFVGRSFMDTRASLERMAVPYQRLHRAKGVDWHAFGRGLTLHAFGDLIERVEWTVFDDLLPEEQSDWSGANRLG